MNLKEAAAQAAGRDMQAEAEDAQARERSYEEPDLGDLSTDGETVPVYVAWSRVMGEIRSIGKTRDFEGGSSGRFKFRGVEDMLNAFGPACRKHSVVVSQYRVAAEYRDTTTTKGAKMRECTVTVTYRIYGPAGDFIECQAMGEASDSGGRSTPKAQSVALRTLLINNGLVPTEDRDADAAHFERGEALVRSAASYATEALDAVTSVGRLRQMHKEIVQNRLAGALVSNEHGAEEPLGALVIRVGRERKERPSDPWATALPIHDGHGENEYSPSCVACKAEQAEADRAAAES